MVWPIYSARSTAALSCESEVAGSVSDALRPQRRSTALVNESADNGICTGVPSGQINLGTFMHSENYDPGSGCDSAYLSCAVNSTHFRHTHVENYEIRLQPLDLVNCFSSVVCFATNFPL